MKAREAIAQYLADQLGRGNNPASWFDESAIAIISALRAAGFVIVPKEPSDDMIKAGTIAHLTVTDGEEAGQAYWKDWTAETKSAWTAMLVASKPKDGQ